MKAMTYEQDRQLDRLEKENAEVVEDVLCFLRDIAECGDKRISLFIEEIGKDGKTHSRRL